MLPLLFASAAIAQPALDDLDSWEAILDNAMDGPEGCWEVAGRAQWRLEKRQDVTSGSADFMVRFDDRRFGDFTFLDAEGDVRWSGVEVERPMTLQFRPRLGRHRGWILTGDQDGLFLRDRAKGERTSWVPSASGALWVDPGDDGFTKVVRADAIRESAKPEDSSTAYVRDGDDHAAFVYMGREPHVQAGSANTHRSRSAIYYGPDGLPTRETSSVEFRSILALAPVRTVDHTIHYDAFEPCAETSPPLPPGRVATVVPRSDVAMPFADAAWDPDLARVESLRLDARRLRRSGRFTLVSTSVQTALLATAAGIVASRDPSQRASPAILGLSGALGAGYVGWGFYGGSRKLKQARALEAEAAAIPVADDAQVAER